MARYALLAPARLGVLISNFMTSLLGAGAGARAGGYVAQRPVERAHLKANVPKEIQGANSTINIVFHITNTVVGLKEQAPTTASTSANSFSRI